MVLTTGGVFFVVVGRGLVASILANERLLGAHQAITFRVSYWLAGLLLVRFFFPFLYCCRTTLLKHVAV